MSNSNLCHRFLVSRQSFEPLVSLRQRHFHLYESDGSVVPQVCQQVQQQPCTTSTSDQQYVVQPYSSIDSIDSVGAGCKSVLYQKKKNVNGREVRYRSRVEEDSINTVEHLQYTYHFGSCNESIRNSARVLEGEILL